MFHGLVKKLQFWNLHTKIPQGLQLFMNVQTYNIQGKLKNGILLPSSMLNLWKLFDLLPFSAGNYQILLYYCCQAFLKQELNEDT